MIDILLVCTKNEELVFCEAKGHSFFAKKGNDIVCAAVTTLLRTSLSVLESNTDISLKTTCSERGMLSFHVTIKDEICKQNISSLLVYAKFFLEKGLSLLCEEYPKHVSLKIKFEEDSVIN